MSATRPDDNAPRLTHTGRDALGFPPAAQHSTVLKRKNELTTPK